MSNVHVSRRAFLQTTAGVAGASLLAGSNVLDAEPIPSAAEAAAGQRSRPLRHRGRRHGRLRPAHDRHPASRRGMRGRRRSLRRPPRTGKGDRRQADSDHAPLQGTARLERHRRHRHRGARPLAQAGGGGRRERGQGRVLRKAHVAQSGGRAGDGRGGDEDRPHRADRRAAHKFGALRQGEGTDRQGRDRRVESDRGDTTAATTRQARGSIRLRRISRRKPSTGIPGSALRPRSPSIRWRLRAGAAGRSTARASPAICWCT